MIPRIFVPSRAKCQVAALPTAPRPTTITSYAGMVHVVDRTLVFAHRPVAGKQLFAEQMVCPKLSIWAGQIGYKNRPGRPRCFPNASRFGRGATWQRTARQKVVERCQIKIQWTVNEGFTPHPPLCRCEGAAACLIGRPRRQNGTGAGLRTGIA